MLNAKVETFISEYFLIKAVLGKHLADEKALFDALCRICLIPKTDAEKLYALAENEVTKKITTDKEFMQYKRMQKYAKIVGAEQNENAEWEEMTAIKGNAILAAMGYNLVSETDASRNAVYSNLSVAAASGTVVAMRITGILQCEGIFLDKNRKEGLKNLSKAAYWNDVVSILALLQYREDNRAQDMARLRLVLEHTSYPELYGVAAKRYGAADDTDVGEVRLLYKAFGLGILKRETYDPKYARILNSKALYLKDKENIVFSPNSEQLSIIGGLPLKLAHESITRVNVDALLYIGGNRASELRAIMHALSNGDLREYGTYRPLCICSDSRYLLNMYANAIAIKNKGVHTETIDVGELIDYDFEPTPNNIFVRSIDEDMDNRFMMFFCGEIPAYRIEAVKSILQSNRRAKFHLNSPGVTLNLGAVLPICFCDQRNAELLKPYCDIVRIVPISEDERSLFIAAIVMETRMRYDAGRVDYSNDIFDGYDIDTVERLVDSAIRANRDGHGTITLSREMLEEYTLSNDRPRIGFGGYGNDRNG